MPDSLSGHFEDVEIGVAWGQLQVLSGFAVRVEDLSAAIDENAGRRIGLDE
jgi:hypothetical protein